MPYKKVSEYSCKKIFHKYLNSEYNGVSINNIDQLNQDMAILKDKKLVAKVDVGEKRRGNNGLLILNKDCDQIIDWIKQTYQKGYSKFLVEEFHRIKKEFYVSFRSDSDGDWILYYDQGGVGMGDAEDKVKKLLIDENLDFSSVNQFLGVNITETLKSLYQMFQDYHFNLMEVNPLIQTTEDKIIPLDFAASLDETALFSVQDKDIIFSSNDSSKSLTPQELNILELDSQTGSSLKFNLINPNGRIWTLVAGGGASVAYTDAIINSGNGDQLANYGEYSGDPNSKFVELYTQNIFELMFQNNTENKVLLIGGAIANFTKVDVTFDGIIKSIHKFNQEFQDHKVTIYVRRGGPNYHVGLNNIKSVSDQYNIPCFVHGPEKFITDIVVDAIDKTDIKNSNSSKNLEIVYQDLEYDQITNIPEFTKNSKVFVWGLHLKLVQRMLDFDYTCGKDEPSVLALLDANKKGKSFMNFFWNDQEILIPVFNNFKDACLEFPQADTLVNLASFRSAYQVSLNAMQQDTITKQIIIAEGIPERWSRELFYQARKYNKLILGPSTVGLITPGQFRGGNTGGTIENIINSNLHYSGQIAIITRSGGLLNETCNIVSNIGGDIYEALSIGGDRYPNSGFIDHVLKYQKIDQVKAIIILGEVGGIQEILVANAVKQGLITKPVIGWCLGTSASFFSDDIQFGHAGASATSKIEGSVYKNNYMKTFGINVPETFEEMPKIISNVLSSINFEANKPILPKTVAQDFDEKYKNKEIRMKKTINSSISSDTTHELKYNGKPITNLVDENPGIGNVIGQLWFKKNLPVKITKYLELIVTISADHGPAVSGAHNTIVSSRAGKDLVSSLCSGLLTIGPRFGGAIHPAAYDFYYAFKDGKDARQFVTWKKDTKQLIMGIGHKVKSSKNPDSRVEILKKYVLENFDQHKYVDYALEIEKVTLEKKDNLILNVDGMIGASMLDIFDQFFDEKETIDLLDSDILNGIFVLARTIGFIGHYNDQKRLKQGLWRGASHDINFIE